MQQAKAAVEPVIERNPDVFDHLAAAGSELLAAYRSAVQDQERRWTARDTPPRAPEERRDPGDDPGTWRASSSDAGRAARSPPRRRFSPSGA